MRPPFYLLQRETQDSSLRPAYVASPRTDLQWGRRMFTPPALPSPNVRREELSFAMDFRTKNRTGR